MPRERTERVIHWPNPVKRSRSTQSRSGFHKRVKADKVDIFSRDLLIEYRETQGATYAVFFLRIYPCFDFDTLRRTMLIFKMRMWCDNTRKFGTEWVVVCSIRKSSLAITAHCQFITTHIFWNVQMWGTVTTEDSKKSQRHLTIETRWTFKTI